MSFNVKVTGEFAKKAKQIAKKHLGIKADVEKLISTLEKNPTIGASLGQNFYKIRLQISGSNKGKSGGARVITYVILDNETVL